VVYTLRLSELLQIAGDQEYRHVEGRDLGQEIARPRSALKSRTLRRRLGRFAGLDLG
jgi:hypothetical protein